MRIDAHQHFWRIDRGDYGWLTPELELLYRDFLPDDLQVLLQAQGIDGTVLVQAAPTVAETHFMLGLAEQTAFIKGVVGWVDFAAQNAAEQITTLAQHDKLVGLRPMIQDIPETDWMLQVELAPAFQTLAQNGLVFDALTFPKHLKNLKQLIGRHPDMKVVVDHASKPQIGVGQFDDWATDMKEIAASTKALVKLSGLVTEAGDSWSVEKLRPYVDHLLESFGPDRMIWGSDWPVCTLASPYERWSEATDALLSELSEQDRTGILGQNAIQFYGLEVA